MTETMQTGPRRDFDRDVLERMPLVTALLEERKKFKEQKKSVPLQGWKVLFIQHQLENHLALAAAILQLGVKPEDLYWIDIPYTSSIEIREAVQQLKVPEKNFDTHQYNLTQRYADYQRSRLIDWIDTFRGQFGTETPLLVLDDGGYFLEAMVCFRKHLKRLAVVEQTARGMFKYRENDAIRHYCKEIPLINVAESAAKKEIESEFIAQSITTTVNAKLDELSKKKSLGPVKDGILVLGYGDIGREVARAVASFYKLPKKKIKIYDTNWRKRKEAKAEGFSVWDRHNISQQFKIVIGCSGKRSFNVWDHVHLAPESVLLSASSGSSEMAREDFVEFAQNNDKDNVSLLNTTELSKAPIHSDIELEIVHHKVIITNGGFPISFDNRSLNLIPAEQIQITVALMLHGAIRAVTTRRKGIVPLGKWICDKLIKDFRELHPATGQSD